MKNFIFKSTDADFKKMFSIIETVQKNVLYLTYQIDWIRKEIKNIVTDKSLQKQVDDFYGPTEWEKDVTAAVHPDDEKDLD